MVDYKAISDIQLVRLLKEGNHVAFTEIYNRYWAKLYLYSRKLLNGDHDQATDISQEVLVYLWEKRQHLEINTSVSGYLYVFVRRKVLRILSTNQIRDKYLIHFKDFTLTTSHPPDEYLIEKETQQKIDKIVAALPKKMKEIFELSRNEYLSRKLIAERLGISEENVKKQISNGLNVLRLKLHR
jgi:RNA polymerase sigma-70 factor (family 1)